MICKFTFTVCFILTHFVSSNENVNKGKLNQIIGNKEWDIFSNPAAIDLIDKLKNIDLTELSISAKCSIRLFNLFIKKDYQVLIGYIDAIGKPGSGLFLGNNYWPGSYSECHQITDSKYCLSGFLAHLPLGNVTIYQNYGNLGVCMPKECTSDDIYQILRYAVQRIPSIAKYISFPNKTGLSQYGGNVLCEKNYKDDFYPGKIATLCLCALILLLCLVGTICELVQENILHIPKGEYVNNLSTTDSQTEFHDKTPIVDSAYQGSFRHGNYSLKNGNSSLSTKFMNAVICFSLIKNSRAVLSTDVPKGAILSINGIRTLSILWVILGHIYSIGLGSGGLVNGVDLLKLLNRFTFLPITNGFFSVDTFFLLSGLLASYLCLKRMDKTGKLPFPIGYLHRFIRLTPAYMFVILFYVNILPMLGDGPFWNCLAAGTMTKPCEQYWWTNFLYINNFYPTELKDECLGWGWYLANDMQFFLISPFILYFMHRWKLIGTLLVNIALIVLSIITTAAIIGYYNLRSLEITADLLNRPPDTFSDKVYIKPYCRIIPYLVGIILGYIIHKQMSLKGKSSRIFALIGWSMAIVCGISAVYGPWGSMKKGGHIFTRTENVIYGSLCRLSWSVAVAWVIYACHFNLGSVVSSILSWRGFIPLSRLTYGAYLIHPMTMAMYFASKHSPTNYTDLTFAFEYVSVAFMSYVAAFILAICVEYPILNLEKKIFNRI